MRVISLVFPFYRGQVSRVEVDRSENAETLRLADDTGNCKTALVCLQDERLCKVMMLVNRCFGQSLLEIPKVNSAIWVHTNLPWKFNTMSEIGIVILTYLQMNCWYMFLKHRSSSTSRVALEVGQSSMVDMRFDSMPITSELIMNLRNPISVAPTGHFSASVCLLVGLGLIILCSLQLKHDRAKGNPSHFSAVQ